MEAYHLLLLLCFVMVYPNLLLQRLSELRICCVLNVQVEEKRLLSLSALLLPLRHHTYPHKKGSVPTSFKLWYLTSSYTICLHHY